jgi:hypothetical protein
MARVSSSAVTQGFKGKVGNIVFRTRNGKTSAYFLTTRKDEPTLKQRKSRQQFTLAVQYAKSAVKDIEAKRRYEEMAIKLGKENAYTMAMADYFEEYRFSKVFYPELYA